MSSFKPHASPPITSLLEDVLGCKWSWSVLHAVHSGVLRPGQMERAIDGISTKVLNERLRKLVLNGILEKHTVSEMPPHVEYHFSELGRRFLTILHQIEELERERVSPQPSKVEIQEENNE